MGLCGEGGIDEWSQGGRSCPGALVVGSDIELSRTVEHGDVSIGAGQRNEHYEESESQRHYILLDHR